MTAFTLEVLDSAGDTLLSFNDNTIVSFKLVESLSGIRPDLESRGLDKNAFSWVKRNSFGHHLQACPSRACRIQCHGSYHRTRDLSHLIG